MFTEQSEMAAYRLADNPPRPTGMESNRILLSDKHGHRMLLSEQEMAVIVYALNVLQKAFDMELQYVDIINKTGMKFNAAFKSEVVAMP